MRTYQITYELRDDSMHPAQANAKSPDGSWVCSVGKDWDEVTIDLFKRLKAMSDVRTKLRESMPESTTFTVTD